MTSNQQRAALQRQVWTIANDVRGSTDDESINYAELSDEIITADIKKIIDITKLNAEIKTTVTKIDQLRTNFNAIVAEIEEVQS